MERKKCTVELTALAEEKNSLFHKALARLFDARICSEIGRPSDALGNLLAARQGVLAFRARSRLMETVSALRLPPDRNSARSASFSQESPISSIIFLDFGSADEVVE
jgi:hypothetical protein